VLSVAARLVPGVRAVQQQVGPFAEAWQRLNEQALRATGPLWVALGDSMTFGLGASAPERGWVGQLADRLAADGHPYRLVNLAFSGARVEDVLERQLPALRSLGEQPSLVTVLIGSNDLFRRRYRDALPELYDQMLDQLPDRAVVGTLPNPRPAARAVNERIYRAEQLGHVVVADMIASSGSWRGKLASDHFHPNDRGYAGIAHTFHAALTAGQLIR
jgi:lysophospholipase L1-like esterase